jgi:hypothetical protein
MHEQTFPTRPTITIRFASARRSGTIRVYYGITRHGADSGFPALKGFGADRAGAGFPTIKCEVDPEQSGYWGVLGWIQWVTQDFGGRRARVELVDRFPSMMDRDLPFLSLGYAPTFFDAPAFNSRPKVDWHASLFLCTLPIMSRKEAIVPLAGFLWGYRIDRTAGEVTSYPCTLANGQDWSAVRRELRKRHPEWTFSSEFETAPIGRRRNA